MKNLLQQKEERAYLFLTSLVLCGLAASLITAQKVTHFIFDLPCSNIIFAGMIYPIIDSICELWGKQIAKQTLYLGLIFQALLAILIQFSILIPEASFWTLQSEYKIILSSSTTVVIASMLAFAISKLLDIIVYQRIKELSNGKKLWLRSNLSTYLGQVIDSFIFVSIIFFDSPQMWHILMGSILIKILLSFLMTPLIYFIVIVTNKYLASNTLAFNNNKLDQLKASNM